MLAAAVLEFGQALLGLRPLAGVADLVAVHVVEEAAGVA
jgi:hypothetical protein